MKADKKKHKESKRRHRWMGWVIALAVLAVLGAAGAVGWSFLDKEHKQAAGLPLEKVDFRLLRDGEYTGSYAGGMYGWRANKVEVTVESGKVTRIELLSSADLGKKNTDQDTLYGRVIAAQSLQVDTVSGATLTSKAYLKGVENALLQAQ